MSLTDTKSFCNIFTVDVEEYYHAENILYSLPEEKIKNLPDRLDVGLRKIIDLLQRTGNKATFFILGCLAEKNKKFIKEISSLGHEIAKDLNRSVNTVSTITGKRILGYRAASFSLYEKLPWFFDCLRKREIIYDSSISFSLFRHNIGTKLANRGYFQISEELLEFPVSLLKIGSVKIPLGGGYFRAYPHWLTKMGFIPSAQERNLPSVFYIHPWELDPKQPRFKISPTKYFRHYFDLNKTEKKLERILRETKTTSIKGFIDENVSKPLSDTIM